MKLIASDEKEAVILFEKYEILDLVYFLNVYNHRMEWKLTFDVNTKFLNDFSKLAKEFLHEENYKNQNLISEMIEKGYEKI